MPIHVNEYPSQEELKKLSAIIKGNFIGDAITLITEKGKKSAALIPMAMFEL